MKATELRQLGVKELNSKLKELQEELFWLKFKNKSGQVEKPANIGKARRDLARVKTILAEKSASAGE